RPLGCPRPGEFPRVCQPVTLNAPSFARRNREIKRRAFPRLPFRPDAAVVPLDDFLTDRKSNAGAGITFFGVESLKNDEDAVRELGLEADAVIAKREYPFPAFPPRGHPHLGRGMIAKLDGIADEILKELYELAAIAGYRRKRLADDFGAGFHNRCVYGGGRFRENLAAVDRREVIFIRHSRVFQ